MGVERFSAGAEREKNSRDALTVTRTHATNASVPELPPRS